MRIEGIRSGVKTRAGRIFLRVTIVLAALCLAALVSCLDGVDYRAYFREPYYTETIARLRTCAATNTISRGELDAGFGSARLTPTINAAQDDPAHGQFRSLSLVGCPYRNRGSRGGRGPDTWCVWARRFYDARVRAKPAGGAIGKSESGIQLCSAEAKERPRRYTRQLCRPRHSPLRLSHGVYGR